jgi:orotate phosphoribosyltransferase
LDSQLKPSEIENRKSKIENSVDLGALLESSGAILNGHFILSSGRHSAVYFEKFRILEQPNVLSSLCAAIAAHFADKGIEVVSGPTTGGIIIAFEVARQMGLPALYVENENGQKTLRRGASVKPNAKVLVVDDVLTMGTSTMEVKDLLTSLGADVVGVGVLIDRSASPIAFGCRFYTAYRVEAETFAADDLPDWLAAIPATKPGTRKG